MNVAMAALEATIHVRGAKGERSIPIGEFHLLPGNTPQRETVLEPGDLITHATLPPPAPVNRSLYLQLPDRMPYAFAPACRAVVVRICPRVRRCRDRKRERKNNAGADCHGRSRNQALAVD